MSNILRKSGTKDLQLAQGLMETWNPNPSKYKYVDFRLPEADGSKNRIKVSSITQQKKVAKMNKALAELNEKLSDLNG